MKSAGLAISFLVVLIATAFGQSNSTERKSFPMQKSDLEMGAIVNLRKFSMAESAYAMSHSQEGFACEPQALTKLEWPDSPNHAKLVDAVLLSGAGRYKFSATCGDNSKPAGKLNIFAVPLDLNADLRTFCASGTFGPLPTNPYVRTSEFPIRSISGGTAESCVVSGKLLK
jgi:hypothetical protein